MKFYHIKGDWFKKPTADFQAVCHNGVLYPIIDDFTTDRKKRTIFVYGEGYIKYKQKDVVTVPLFSGDAQDWNGYLEQYGKNCLYYSISGHRLNESDAATYNARHEFHSIILNGNIEGYTEFVERMERINELQIEAFKNRFGMEYEILYCDYIFKPQYSIYGLPMPYMLNVVEDDKKMEKLYRAIRSRELIAACEAEPQNAAILNRPKEIKFEDYGQDRVMEYYANYDVAFTNARHLRTKILMDVHEQIDKELAEDNGVFPQCCRDRVRYFFGDEACELYTYLVENYLKTEIENEAD